MEVKHERRIHQYWIRTLHQSSRSRSACYPTSREKFLRATWLYPLPTFPCSNYLSNIGTPRQRYIPSTLIFQWTTTFIYMRQTCTHKSLKYSRRPRKSVLKGVLVYPTIFAVLFFLLGEDDNFALTEAIQHLSVLRQQESGF